jgi:hypothetical protein
MKAAVCEEPRKIVIKNVEEPKLKDDEVLVRLNPPEYHVRMSWHIWACIQKSNIR